MLFRLTLFNESCFSVSYQIQRWKIVHNKDTYILDITLLFTLSIQINYNVL